MKEKRPHIAVNTRLLLKGKLEGIGRFEYEVLKRLVTAHPEAQFSFFFDRPWDDSFVFGENVTPYKLFPQARHPFLYYLFFNYAVTSKLKQLKPDVFFSPDGYLSLRTAVPQVAVFHDLSFEHFPQDISKLEAWYYCRYFPLFAKKAKSLLAVSEYTKQDIIKQYGIAPEKITVTCNAASDQFREIADAEKEDARKRYAEGKPYFLFVGAIQPRKNLVNLISAFDRFKAREDSPVQLVIAGRKAWNFDQVIHTYQQSPFKDQIHFTGYVPDAELNAVYGGALALCYVPYFEGFGIPILEAMHAGIPVVCSRVSSMPEVAGDAALLVDPLKPDDIAGAMMQIWKEPETRVRLVQNGILRRRLYTWERAADAVWDTLTGAILNTR